MTPEHRLKRLKHLLDEMKLKGYKTYASIERDFDVNASYISQIVNGNRQLGESAARKMEVQLKLPTFYFDKVNDDKSLAELADILEKGSVAVATDENDKDISVPIYSLYFCCGNGNGGCQFEEIKGYRKLPPSFFIDKNLKPENFKLVCASSDSMKPYINDKDEVGVDISDTEVKDGEIYAILLDGDRMFKQIFREAGGALRLRSFNPEYPDKLVTAKNHESLIIVGRQVYRAG